MNLSKRISNFSTNQKYVGFWNALKILFSRRILKRDTLNLRIRDYKHSIKIRLGISDEMLIYNFLKDKVSFPLSSWSGKSVIVDAGANIGMFSCLLASLDNTQIISIEPDPENIVMLNDNISAYENVTVVESALWYSKTKLSISNPDAMYMSRIVSEESSPNSQVQALSLGDIREIFDLETIDLLKLDIEGSEYEVVQSESFKSANIRICLIEVHEKGDAVLDNQLFDTLHSKFPNHLVIGEYYCFSV